ncbi:hypothetical protein FI667_g14225, partial [Globisporangium splendens]
MPRTAAAGDGAELGTTSSSSPTLAKSRGRGSTGTPQNASTSFFIVQEPVISPSGGVTPQKPTNYSDADARNPKNSKATSPGMTILGVHKEGEHESDDVAPIEQPLRKGKTQSILNRVDSAPDLPLHSSVSASVYSSSKKWNLMRSADLNGAGSHLIALQRSRLIPLPINIRTGTLQRDAARKRDEWTGSNSNSSVETTESRSQQQLEERANDDFAIESLKVRLAQMEKDMARALNHKHALEKQSAQLSTEKLQLHPQIDQLEKSVLQQKHAFEKLSDRYANAYTNLQKLTEQQKSPTPDNHTGATQSVLQALTRENQDFQRKLRVLEERHVEDKAIAANQEKKIKRLRAEMETTQHMNDASTQDDRSESQNELFALKDCDMKKPDASPALSSINGKPLGAASAKAASSAAAALSTSSTGSNGSSSHLIGTEDCQYIDPNILKVLEKVDSQFSITNAINLSAVLKKWLNSCLHAVNSTHLSSVLQSSTDTITGIPSREVLCIPLVHELQPRQPHRVFAVLQAWNAMHQKPFTTNDQILGGLLTIQAGTIFLQAQVAKTLQRVNRELLQILRMPQEILQELLMNYAPSPSVDSLPGSASSDVPSISPVHLVATAQKKLAECIGIRKVKIFVHEPELMKIWHVGSEVDVASGYTTLVRKYSNVLSSLCGLVIKSNSAGIVLEDPVSEAAFNDTVDLKGGAGGMYLYPIGSPWGTTSLGMIQVARSAVRFSSNATRGIASDGDPVFAAAVHKEKQSAQQSQDSLLMELIELFARMFASLLHHVKAHQLYGTCPREIQDARLAYVTDRLELLESEYAKAQAEAEDEEARIEQSLAATAMMEQRILESAQQERLRRASFIDPSHALARNAHTTRRVSSAGASRKDMPIHHSSMVDGRYLYTSSPSEDVYIGKSARNGDLSTATGDAKPSDLQSDSQSVELVATEHKPSDSGGEADMLLQPGTDNTQRQFQSDEAPTNRDDEQQEVDLEEHEPEERLSYNDGEEAEAEEGVDWQQQDPSQDDGNDTIGTTWQEQHEAGDTNDLWYEYEHQDEHNAEEDEEQHQEDLNMDTNSWRDASDGSPTDDPSPVGLLSTDSMCAIDLNYSDGSPADDEAASP